MLRSGLSDTHPKVLRKQIELLRALTPAQRFLKMLGLTQTVIGLSRAGIRRCNPGLSEEEIRWLYVGYVYGKDLANRARSYTKEKWPCSQRDCFAAMFAVVQIFEKLGVPYYVTGAMASSLHGVARTTLAVDIVAQLSLQHVELFAAALEDSYYLNREMIQDAVEHHSSFNILHLESMYKVDIFAQKDGAFDLSVMERKKSIQITEPESMEFFVAANEDTIISKLDWYRKGGEVSDKQWNDILGMLQIHEGVLDMDYMRHWADELNLGNLLAEAIQDAKSAIEQ
ncbi:MAG: hypothetical protein NTX50_16855 [Candidatus Sumerlaeota bacterium]|nr:hypothetical protein [Candidatus Sumerlaeota bacterium]